MCTSLVTWHSRRASCHYAPMPIGAAYAQVYDWPFREHGFKVSWQETPLTLQGGGGLDRQGVPEHEPAGGVREIPISPRIRCGVDHLPTCLVTNLPHASPGMAGRFTTRVTREFGKR